MAQNRNPKTPTGPLWFRAKLFGWGWYPASWQGWAITLAYVLAAIASTARLEIQDISTPEALLYFVPELVILTVFLIIICWLTGEKPRWRWGN